METIKFQKLAQLSLVVFFVELELKSAQPSVDDENAWAGAVVVVALVEGVEKKSQLIAFEAAAVGCVEVETVPTGAAGIEESQSGWAAVVVDGPDGGGAKKPPPEVGAEKLKARPPVVLGSRFADLEGSLLIETEMVCPDLRERSWC
jgi:hypothetical protein